MNTTKRTIRYNGERWVIEDPRWRCSLAACESLAEALRLLDKMCGNCNSTSHTFCNR